MKRPGYLLKLIISAIIVLLSAVSCAGNNENDYGEPPSPETTFCDSDGIEVYMKWAAENFPAITALRETGLSEAGRSIYTIEISDRPGTAEAEPAVLIAGSIHGHEQAGTGVSLKLLEYLLTAYNSGEAEAVNIVKNYKLHIMPVINPDGLEISDRYNENGVDLNRNFGYNWFADEIYNGEAAFDQAETRAVRDDFLEYPYCMALILHTAVSYSGMGIYAPWDALPLTGTTDFISRYLPNYGIIETMGEAYSAEVETSGGPLYPEYFHYQEGADWYPIYGSVNDWALGTMGTVCYSVELYGDQHFSFEDDVLLNNIWEAHRDAMLEIIKKASLGTGGRLMDAGGKPVAGAEIRLGVSGGRDFTPEPYTELAGITGKDGYFRFLTEAGIYRISFSDSANLLETDITVNTAGETDAGGGYRFFPDYYFP